MLKVDMVHVIRHKFKIERKSLRQVAIETGLSRNTVKKYIEKLNNSENQEVDKCLKKRRRSPVKEIVIPRIIEILNEWKSRTTSKQRVTSQIIYEQLLTEGVKVSRETISLYLRELKRDTLETYIPLIHYAGDEAQVDFFEVTVDENGTRRKAWMFLMHLAYSKKDYVCLSEKCDQVAFLSAHVKAFKYFQGVPRRCVYDNLTAAVKKVLYKDRELTDKFKALTAHYLFEPCFARPATGHDKGMVECRGKTIRLNYMTPIPIGENLEIISKELLEKIERRFEGRQTQLGETMLSLFEKEKNLFIELPFIDFDYRKIISVQISSQALIQVESAHYSVPSHWNRLQATVYIDNTIITVFCGQESQVYSRLKKGEKSIVYKHYLKDLARKPQALRQVAPEVIKELGEPFNTLWTHWMKNSSPLKAARALSQIIQAIVNHGEETVKILVEEALSKGCSDDLMFLSPLLRHVTPKITNIPQQLIEIEVEKSDLKAYTILMKGNDYEH